jgi:hypothetical protein
MNRRVAVEHFTLAYRGALPEDPPWYHAEPDADLMALMEQVLPASRARVLDLGAEPEQVMSVPTTMIGAACVAQLSRRPERDFGDLRPAFFLLHRRTHHGCNEDLRGWSIAGLGVGDPLPMRGPL